MSAIDPFETTLSDASSGTGPGQSYSPSQPGSSYPPQVSSVAMLVGAMNAFAVTLVIAWHAPALIALYERDARPLAAAGAILLVNAVGAKSRDIVAAVRNLRRRA